MPDDIQLPTDLEIRLMLVHQEHLSQEYDNIRKLFAMHEVELAVLWGAVVILGTVVLVQTIKNKRAHNE